MNILWLLRRAAWLFYQYFIGFPILTILTFWVASTTIIFFPFRNKGTWLHRLQGWLGRMYCHLFAVPVSVDGAEHIVPGQSYVCVANHSSAFDIFVIYGWLPVPFKWIMKKELKYIPLIGTACHAAGHVFIDRSNPRSSMKSLQTIKSELTNGISTVIFPEGTRTKDGNLGAFKRGAFQIAHDLDLPILPLSLSGCFDVMSKKDNMVHRHPIHMHIGQPIHLKDIPHAYTVSQDGSSRPDTRLIANYVHDRIAQDLISYHPHH